MRMFMLAVLVTVVLPVCSVAQVQPTGQPKEAPLDFAGAVDTPGFQEYVEEVLRLVKREAKLQEFVALMAERREFLIYRAEKQWDNEARVIRHMIRTAIEAKEKQAGR